jgi:hypothetical protein
MTYQPKLGGHAPDDLREEFLTALDEYVNGGPEDGDEVAFYKENVAHLWHLAGQLWNCTDFTPATMTDAFENLGYLRNGYGVDHQAHTYSRAARLIRDHLEKHMPEYVPRHRAVS